jgi:hypothetical protein
MFLTLKDCYKFHRRAGIPIDSEPEILSYMIIAKVRYRSELSEVLVVLHWWRRAE